MHFRTHILSIACCFMAVSGLQAQEKSETGFRPLFNEKNLDGWVAVNTAPSTWSVAEGLLVCTGKPIGELRTDRMYQNFILELQWRHMLPKGNAGVFIWADDITARGVPFHRGIEVQVLENAHGNSERHTTHGDIFPIHGATMVPVNGRNGNRAFPTENRSKPSPEWNHYRIECQDGDISLSVNGKMVTQGKQCSPRKGYICLESEGGIVHYKNIRIKELADTPIAPEQIAIANRGYRCLYNGIDLTGWQLDSGAEQAWQPSDWILKFNRPAATKELAISSSERFGDLSFIIDIRFSRTPSPVTLALRDTSAGAITLDPEDSQLKALLEKPGQWNRIEGTLKAHKLSMNVNAKPWKVDSEMKDVVATGPISIQPHGPTDFANIYVKNLQ